MPIAGWRALSEVSETSAAPGEKCRPACLITRKPPVRHTSTTDRNCSASSSVISPNPLKPAQLTTTCKLPSRAHHAVEKRCDTDLVGHLDRGPGVWLAEFGRALRGAVGCCGQRSSPDSLRRPTSARWQGRSPRRRPITTAMRPSTIGILSQSGVFRGLILPDNRGLRPRIGGSGFCQSELFIIRTWVRF